MTTRHGIGRGIVAAVGIWLVRRALRGLSHQHGERVVIGVRRPCPVPPDALRHVLRVSKRVLRPVDVCLVDDVRCRPDACRCTLATILVRNRARRHSSAWCFGRASKLGSRSAHRRAPAGGRRGGCLLSDRAMRIAARVLLTRRVGESWRGMNCDATRPSSVLGGGRGAARRGSAAQTGVKAPQGLPLVQENGIRDGVCRESAGVSGGSPARQLIASTSPVRFRNGSARRKRTTPPS
jgi:hypothetical protein